MKPRIELQRHCIGAQDVDIFVFLFQSASREPRIELQRHCIGVQDVAIFVFFWCSTTRPIDALY